MRRIYPVSTYMARRLSPTALEAKTAAIVESTPPDAAIIALSVNSVFRLSIVSSVNFSGAKNDTENHLESTIGQYRYKFYLIGS